MINCYLSHNCKKYKDNACLIDTFCIRKFKEDSLFDLGLISEDQRIRKSLVTLPDYDPPEENKRFKELQDIEKNIVSMIESGTNFYIYSSGCGNGKTAWSLRLAQSYIDKIWYDSDITCRVLYISVPKFLLELKSNISNKSSYIEHIQKYVMDCDLVIWDDIGSKGGTEFEIENMLSIINCRIDNKRSNIYTSNILPQNLDAIVGPRLGSRIRGMSHLIELRGVDKRGFSL